MTFKSLSLCACVAAIFSLGLLMIFNTSSAAIIDLAQEEQSLHESVIRHIIYGCIGLIVGYFVYKIGYKRILLLSFPVLIFLTFLLLLTFVPGVGQMRNGAYRWIGIAGLTLQPSELVKYAVPIFFIFYLIQAKSPLSLKDYFIGIGLVSIPTFLILIEPDHGTTMILGTTIIMLLFLTKVSFRYWAWPLIALTALAVVAGMQVPYVKARLQVYVNPELDVQGKGHQPFQAKIATGSGGSWGRGLGKSIQKLSYLPEAKNDYIAAIYAEELGFIGIVFLLTLYMLFSLMGFWIAFSAVDRAGFLLATSVTFLIFFQAFLNLGVVSGLLPSTGLNLPFFSQGGTSLMANIAALFILVDIDVVSKRLESRQIKASYQL